MHGLNIFCMKNMWERFSFVYNKKIWRYYVFVSLNKLNKVFDSSLFSSSQRIIIIDFFAPLNGI